MQRIIRRIQSWDHAIVDAIPPRWIFLILLRVYQEYLCKHGHGDTHDNLGRAVNEWGAKAYPKKE